MAARPLNDIDRADAEAAGAFETNVAIAMRLRDYADLLEQQGEDGFRQRAYRRAGETLEKLDRPVTAILDEEGREGLIALPGVGKAIAGAIVEMVKAGRWSQLDRLKGEMTPDRLFQTLPGVGPELAKRFAEDMDLETLEELETALHDPDVKIEGIGPRRRAILTALIAERLGHPLRRAMREDAPRPPVELLLKVDALYRERAAKGDLRRIAPKRFNPAGEAWLPILHVRHDDWHFTVLYSNTQRAHELGKTGDWVVIYHHRDGSAEARSTVVTETHGPLTGKRVVRGRETECADVAT
ncbi:MAG: helix-hairpin-helix domain-containing protein [Oricola sp.]